MVERDAENLDILRRADLRFPHGDWQDEYREIHASDVVIRRGGVEPTATNVEDHILESAAVAEAFPDVAFSLPHRVIFAADDWTCVITRITGTMTGSLKLPDGTVAAPTGKRFELELCAVARWEDGRMVEENIFMDRQALMKQVGIDGPR
jgi:predicted ester cyclase